MNEKREKLYALDILRVVAAFGILFYHMRIHLQYNFGILNTFLSQGSLFMVLFFVLSGFSLYYNYYERNLLKLEELKKFYIKRFTSIYPCYLLITLIYMIGHTNDIKEALMMLPIEVLLLQQFIPGARNFQSNSLTWFLSCLLLCYFLFPFIKGILEQIHSHKTKRRIAGLLYIIAAIMPFIVHFMEYDWVYNNPYFKLLEFVLGMMTADYYFTREKKEKRGNVFIGLGTVLLLVVAVTILNSRGIGTYASYIFFTLPLFMVLIYEMALAKPEGILIRVSKSKVVKYLSEISYTLYLAQAFLIGIGGGMVKTHSLGNIIIMSLIMLVIAIVLCEAIQKPCKKLLGKRLLNQ